MTKYAKHYSTRQTPQSEPIPGKAMKRNAAGGYAFQVDDWARLDRFLILGSEKGSYYASPRKLTKKNAEAVQRCIQVDGVAVVDRIVNISIHGRAPKNDPAIFALAMCAGLGDDATRRAAFSCLPKVCRIGTHLFQFCESVKQFRGFGRGLRDALAYWYLEKPFDDLAYQLVKYQQRDGWSHRDVLRLAHPKAEGTDNQLLRYAVTGEYAQVDKPCIIHGVEAIKTAENPEQAARCIIDHGLPRECVPTRFLTSPGVWDALLNSGMPFTAMVRNLGNLSKCGLLKPLSKVEAVVCARLADREKLRRARVHPVALLLALRTYVAGRGLRGSGKWIVCPRVVNALDDAFYTSFDFVEPTGKRWLLGVDVSSSMTQSLAGTPLTCAEAAGALALTTAKVEPEHYIHGFCGGRGASYYARDRVNLDGFVDLGITTRMRMTEVLKRVQDRTFGSTDCALPMLFAKEYRVEVDAFVVLTDSQTWNGAIHPVQALRDYRQKMGINAKLIVVGMVSNNVSIADPDDPGILDVVGFDTNVPTVMNSFVGKEVG